MSEDNVVSLFPAYKAGVPAVITQEHTRKEEENTVRVIGDYLLFYATALLNGEDEVAMRSLPKDVRRQKILYRALQLAKQADTALEKKIFEELGLTSSEEVGIEGPSVV